VCEHMSAYVSAYVSAYMCEYACVGVLTECANTYSEWCIVNVVQCMF
jgi:hypothetical protein